MNVVGVEMYYWDYFFRIKMFIFLVFCWYLRLIVDSWVSIGNFVKIKLFCYSLFFSSCIKGFWDREVYLFGSKFLKFIFINKGNKES